MSRAAPFRNPFPHSGVVVSRVLWAAQRKRVPVAARPRSRERTGSRKSPVLGNSARHAGRQGSGPVRQARHHSGRLPQRQPEERLQRRASPDRCVREDGLPPALAGRFGKPLRLWIEAALRRLPTIGCRSRDRQRSALGQRGVAIVSVRGAVGSGLRSAHAA